MRRLHALSRLVSRLCLACLHLRADTKAWEVDTLRGHVNNVSSVIFHPKQVGGWVGCAGWVGGWMQGVQTAWVGWSLDCTMCGMAEQVSKWGALGGGSLLRPLLQAQRPVGHC